jgi:UDP-glucose 4-epimerase
MKIIVCGGAGYIGSHMCKQIANAGHELAVVDNLSTGHEAALRWGRFYRGSIGDAHFLDRVFADFKPDGVMHFAAKSIVPESVANPAAYYRNNVAATITLLDKVRATPGCAFVFSSTASIFGVPQTELIDETHPKVPVNPYGRSKIMIEQVLADYWGAYTLPSVCLRYFNAAGADESGEIGEAHSPETHLIPIVLEAALGRRGPVSIFGEDYATPDGTCIRDYIHVNDLCEAHLLGLNWLKDNPGAQAFNLGNGLGFSVREVIDVASKVTSRAIPCSAADRRPGDPDRLIANAAKAQSKLGWLPKRAGLAQIIESAWRWHRERRY